MPTNQGPTIIAIFDTLTAAMPEEVPVILGSPATFAAPDTVVVALDVTDAQPYRTATGARRKEEAYDVTCGIWCEAGNDDMRERFTRGFFLRAVLEAAINANPTMGQPNLTNTRVTVSGGSTLARYDPDIGGTGIELTIIVHVDASVYNQGAVTP